MDDVLGVLLVMLLGAAAILAVPISLLLLWSRTRSLRERVETLEAELLALQGVRGVREVGEVGGVREVRGVQEVQEVQAVQQVQEVQQVRSVPPAVPAPAAPTAPTAHAAPDAPDAPHAPDAPDAPPAPRAPHAPHAPDAPPAPHAPRAPRAPRAPQLLHAPAPDSLETALGARWLLYIGIVAIVVGVAYFEKLAMDYGWITPVGRVIQGALGGLALMFAGTRFIRRGYVGYGQIIAGGGGAILYVSTYAAFNYYALIDRPVAFVLMVAITLLVAWLADRERSQGLALFAVGGGFATPFLLPGTTDAQIALFTYDAILIAGTALLAHRRDWPYLHLVSYAFTLMTIVGWADRFYAPEKYLRTEAYLTVYFAMFLYIGRECRRKDSEAGRLVGLLLWSAPVFYYFGSLLVLVDHDVALLAWLVALMLAGGVAASRLGPLPGSVTWLAVALPLVVWCATPVAQTMRMEGLITLAAVYVIALLAELELTFFRDEAREPVWTDIAWIHLNPLATYAGVYLLVSPVSLVNAGYLAAAFAAWQGAIVVLLWQRRNGLALHYLAVGFTLAAIAIALVFSGTAITAAWAVEGAVVIALGGRQRLDWLRIAGVVLFGVAVAQTVRLLASPAPVTHVVFLNPRAACAALVVTLCYVLAWLDWRDREALERDTAIGAAMLTAQFVTLALLTSEINAFWAIRDGRLERQLTLSVTWGLYATALIVVGLWRGYAPLRYFAMVVLAITIVKVFFIDMAELDRIYRVGSAIVLGILLLLTSYLYSRREEASG